MKVKVLKLHRLGMYGFIEIKVMDITKFKTAEKIALNCQNCFAYEIYEVDVADNGQRKGKPTLIKSVVFGKWYSREEIVKLAEENPNDRRYQNILRYMKKESLGSVVITRTGNWLIPKFGAEVIDHTAT